MQADKLNYKLKYFIFILLLKLVKLLSNNFYINLPLSDYNLLI